MPSHFTHTNFPQLDSQFYDVGGVDASYYSGPPDLYIREPVRGFLLKSKVYAD